MLGSNLALLIFKLSTVLTSLIFILFLSVKNVNVTLKPPNNSEVNVQTSALFNWSNVTEIVSFSNTAMFTNVTFQSCHVTGRAPPPSRERALSWIRKSRVNKARECLALKRHFTFFAPWRHADRWTAGTQQSRDSHIREFFLSRVKVSIWLVNLALKHLG